MPTSVATRLSYEALPGRVVFGVGAVGEVAAEVELLGGQRVLVIDGLLDAALVERLERELGERHAGTLGEVAQHVPAELAASALARSRELGADCLLALGGGSATGVAKAVAKETGLPIIAVPTTYAGSEMTPIWGITTEARKTTGRDLAVLPRTVIYDPELTVSLPTLASAASGMNAVAHCVEAMWTPAANPVTDAVAAEGITLLAAGLRGSVREPRDLEARGLALQGAWLGGTALAVGGTGLHHKICHVLGGTFDLPHAEVHAIVLPWVVEHYREAAPAALARVARALDAEDAVAGLRELGRDLGLEAGLADFGLAPSDVELASELAAAVAPDVPAPTSREQIAAILNNAMTTGRE
jgi:alcohol dehydrogenase class IV